MSNVRRLVVIIRQHGQAGELFDINAFLAEISILREVKDWQVSVQECIGPGALAIEEKTSQEQKPFTSQELREAYRGIYQTIDGCFVGLAAGSELCRLEAIDSSFWEVSGPVELEAEMLKKYGAYVRAGA